MTTNTDVKRPLRLWVVAVMNVLVATISMAAITYLLFSSNPNIPNEIRPGVPNTILALGTSGLLIVSSILALLRIRFARWLMLFAAVVFFGILCVQNLAIVLTNGSALVEGAAPKLWMNAIRSALEMAFNVWVLLSARTALFFRNVRP